jgi:hypothetical protein
MTDEETRQLLRLLHQFIHEYDHYDNTVTSVVEEIAMSQDVTTDEVDNLRREIEWHFI